ncbi:MAG: exodeoxyribonuclease III [Zoogloeaceae bacterium]|jgi:exodeoxyribonuclease-3|nr:exodeoxyribonuclease III [Zoogloeaceae bacterium]
MKIAAWNVNSLKMRLPHLLDWLAQSGADVVCLQETKLEDPNFPRAELAAAGYQSAYGGQKTYNGVALVSRHPLKDIQIGNPYFPDAQKRLIAATIDGIRVVSAYFPNGQAVGSDKYAYKLAWIAALTRWIRENLATCHELALCGDFNIAPEDRDVYNPDAWRGQILCSEPERAAFSALLDLGLKDSFRLFSQPEKSFSWWDYRQSGFLKNHGLRIDHILLSSPLAVRATAAGIDRAPRGRERPSDHAPIWADCQ